MHVSVQVLTGALDARHDSKRSQLSVPLTPDCRSATWPNGMRIDHVDLERAAPMKVSPIQTEGSARPQTDIVSPGPSLRTSKTSLARKWRT